MLNRHGISLGEFQEALPAAIETLRGSMSASTADRREFLGGLLDFLLTTGAVQSVRKPEYGDDTVYRLSIVGQPDVAVIQKGCPDGAHSSITWSTPDWAGETYLWWLCDSMTYHPGEHIQKGVNRLRKRFFDDRPDTLAGVIFHNQVCGGPRRCCPKMNHSVTINSQDVPPPCVYIMPDRDADAAEWNWDGRQQRTFPTVLLKAFGVPGDQVAAYTGHIGFQRRAGGGVRTTIASRFGPGRVTTHRS